MTAVIEKRVTALPCAEKVSAAVVTETITAAVQLDKTVAVVVAGTQGPPGPPGPPGIGGADIDPNPDNQIEARPSGLFVKPSTWAEKEW